MWTIHVEMGVPRSVGSDVPNLMKGCTKFNEGCTKFCEGCTKGSKVRSEVWIDSKSLCYGFLNEIMIDPCSDGGPRSTRFGCNKFNEGYTKLCEGCTKGPKVRSEVGIDTQSLNYGFLNEIVDHPCWNGGPEICWIGCTKFCDGWCTKSPKMLSEVWIDPKSLSYGFINEIMTHSCSDGGPGITRLGCTKFNEGCTKFCEECANGSKMHSDVGIGPK